MSEGTMRAGVTLTTLALALGGGFALIGMTAPERPCDPEALVKQLSRRAALYERAAVGFSCDETVLVGRFSGRTGENRKEEKTRYNYLYEGSPAKGFEEIRILQDRNDEPRSARIVDPDLPVPGAYDWALLFTDRHRPYFRFECGGEEMLDSRATRVVLFQGAATWNRGRSLEEWSGRVWVDRETGNFVKILAAPNRQDELLPLRMAKWQTGMRLGGIPLKKQPRGYRYELSFTVERFGLAFPGEAVTRLFVLTSEGEEEIRQRISQQFDNYVFFNVHSEEEFREGAPAQAPAPKP